MYLKELSLATVLIKLLCTLLRPYLICIICPYIRENEEEEVEVEQEVERESIHLITDDNYIIGLLFTFSRAQPRHVWVEG